jgi:HEPN domain-containing protein
MPARRESLYPLDWLAKSQQDFRRVKARLDEGDTEDAAFHLQQSVEKCLKAYLLFKGWKLKKIHDLEALLDETVKYDKSLEQFRGLCQQVTGYYLIERYPMVGESPSSEEIAGAYKHTNKLMKKIRNVVK